MKNSYCAKFSHLFSIALALGTFASGFSQTIYPGDLILTTQEEVDDAIQYTTISGNLTIQTQEGTPYPITNLDGLANLSNIEGNLTIDNNPSLDNTLGLLNLIEAGSVYITNNTVLTELNGLSNLAVIDALEITNNNQLTQFCGLFLLFDIREGNDSINWNYLIIGGGGFYVPGIPGISSLIGEPCVIENEEPPAPEIFDPILWIQGLHNEGILNRGQSLSLLKKLKRNHTKVLKHQLNAFVSCGILTEELAEPIYTWISEQPQPTRKRSAKAKSKKGKKKK